MLVGIMKRIGFIIPNYPNERRVALTPRDVRLTDKNKLVIEKGFGKEIGYTDNDYVEAGCEVLSREEVFESCEIIFSLKLIQKEDYDYLRDNQVIVGWTHPNGSGAEFMKEQALPKKLAIVDLDNIFPKLYYNEKSEDLYWIPRNFVYKNSLIAGMASVNHALISHGILPDSNTKVAVLSPGNVAQGAFNAITKYNCDTRMFVRERMDEFRLTISDYDIIINGIEISSTDEPIIDADLMKKIKDNALVIDAAADAGYAIVNTEFTSYEKPIRKMEHFYYYCINNTPSIYYKNASYNISESFTKYAYNIDYNKVYSLIDKLK